MTEMKISGFQVRPFMLADAEEVVAMINAAYRALIGLDVETIEEMMVEWQTPGFKLESDTHLVLTPGGSIVAYGDVWDVSDPHIQLWSYGCVHPDYIGRGLGRYMLEWIERRACQSIDKAPPGAQVVLAQTILEKNRAAGRLFDIMGYQLARTYYHMRIAMDSQPPTPELPPGITVRSMQSQDELKAILTTIRDSFRDHWGYVDESFESMYSRWSFNIENDPYHDPSLWFVAFVGDELAGVSICNPRTSEDKGMGWVRILGVRRPWRGRGLGRALLRYSFTEFYRRGIRRVGLGVDSQSLTGATRLYERAGMSVYRVYASYEKILRTGEDLRTQNLEG